MKVLIVDDEKFAREAIEQMVQIYCPSSELLPSASGVEEAYKTINQLNPDLVLLDIQMKDGTGFDLLDKFTSFDFKVIFITAFNEFAVKAFKYSALDYILKPVDPEDIVNAFNRATEVIANDNLKLKLEAYFSNTKNLPKSEKKIVLKTSESIHLVKITQIVRCESDSNYTRFYLEGDKNLIVAKTLKEYDELLSPYGFFRVHQSHLINFDFVDRYDKTEGGILIMTNNHRVPVSFRKKEHLIQFLNKL